MTPEQIAALIPVLTGTGGTIVALLLWNRDLIKQRDYERQRVSELTDRYTTSTTAGNDAIRDLTDATIDAIELLTAAQTGTTVPPRRRPRNAS